MDFSLHQRDVIYDRGEIICCREMTGFDLVPVRGLFDFKVKVDPLAFSAASWVMRPSLLLDSCNCLDVSSGRARCGGFARSLRTLESLRWLWRPVWVRR